MLSVLSKSEKEAQAAAKDQSAAEPTAADTDGTEAKQTAKGINRLSCLSSHLHHPLWAVGAEEHGHFLYHLL